MPPSSRPWPPAGIGLGPPLAGALVVALGGVGGPAAMPAWLVLGSAVFVVAILEMAASLTKSQGARQPELAPLTEAGVVLVRLASVAVGSLEAMIGVAIGLGRPQAVPLVVGAGLLMLIAAIAIGMRRMSAALQAVRAAGHGELVKGYGPFAYSNKDDPRIWVPKLGGMGHTLNFAHRASWLILAAFLVPPVVVVALVLAFAVPRR